MQIYAPTTKRQLYDEVKIVYKNFGGTLKKF